MPVARKATLTALQNPFDGDVIDRALVLFFEGPNSFTGEDCAEFHLHGSRAVIYAMFAVLARFENVRLAEAGEFSRRAFENGKHDLVEIEGLSELVKAETEAQRRLAIHFSSGEVSARHFAWMDRLSHARAMIEAELDFADEGDIPGSVSEQIWSAMDALVADMRSALAGTRASEVIRSGFRVVIAGLPNAGKSSLLNYLAKRDVAIVTDTAGTTRDLISVDLDLNGYMVSLVDTAGLRETEDPVERIGIRKAKEALDSAHLILYLHAGVYEEQSEKFAAPVLHVGTKGDLGFESTEGVDLVISTKDGSGFDSLLERISEELNSSLSEGADPLVLNQRQEEALKACRDAVEWACQSVDAPLEVRAESLRVASIHLGRLVGNVDADSLLGVIFSQFCVGK